MTKDINKLIEDNINIANKLAWDYYKVTDAATKQTAYFTLPELIANATVAKMTIETDTKVEFVTLAEGVEYSFTRAEIEEISAILTRIKTPKQEDMNPYDAVIYGKQRYLREKYAKLKTEIEKKERKGEHIGCVFSYFKKMLENDTYKPLAYKKEDEE